MDDSGESTENCYYLLEFEAKFKKLSDAEKELRWSLFMKKTEVKNLAGLILQLSTILVF
jgi:hypothetical protein